MKRPGTSEPRLLLIGNYPPDKQKSMFEYLKLFSKGLTEKNVCHDIIVPNRIVLPASRPAIGIWKWIAYIDKFVIFPSRLLVIQRRYFRIHICDHSNAMYAYFLPKQKITVTCHDVIAIQAARGMVPGWVVGFSGRVFQWLIFNGLNTCSKIYCVSELTQRDLKRLLGSSPASVCVAHNALNPNYRPVIDWLAALPASAVDQLKNRQFFLHVGSDLPRKNRTAVVQIFALLVKHHRYADAALVFVGPLPNVVLIAEIKALGIADKVVFFQDISQTSLNSFYSGALALIFPSIQEGFGWPVLEAQACGCPVFASDIAPMPEVGGDAACYFPLASFHTAAAIILAADLPAMRVAGLENAKRFKLETMTAQLLDEPLVGRV
jgi:glycosyltransferase involved in cell wall biosynthesis